MSRTKNKKHMSRRSQKAGLPPGTPMYIGPAKTVTGQPRITVTEYNGEQYTDRIITHLGQALPLKPAPTVTWINVDGIHDVSLLAEFGETFNLHPLMMEDILNTEQRPKAELQENLIYVILKMFDFNPGQSKVVTEQISLVLGEQLVITFQEDEGDEFEPVRERLRANHSRFRRSGAGYLAYALIDTVVDRYFIALEKIGEGMEEIEEGLESELQPNTLQQLHRIKRELIFLRKYIWPVREAINALRHADTRLIDESTQAYLRDVYDHTIQVMDTLETYRDLLGGMQDLYLSILSNRMNEIMKVLTVIATIFIPLTFIAGVYGMNFRYMPELNSPWGYPLTWLVMILIATGMLVYFRLKRWF